MFSLPKKALDRWRFTSKGSPFFPKSPATSAVGKIKLYSIPY